ncbi:MAG: ABC transporter permease subunit [Clostridiales bacterium]|nr:ABC transporter permease subunit [Clostridiales bacterium]
MNFFKLLEIEFLKMRRSKIIPLIFIAPILVVTSGVLNISAYFTPEYTNAWAAMFIQSSLLYSYYLLPFSMLVVCIMMEGVEVKNNGILKMLTLPFHTKALCLAKSVILLFYLFLEILIFFITFVLAGLIATHTMNISETLPLYDLVKWCIGLFLTMIPGICVMWLITVIFEKPFLSAGMNLLFIIPSLIVANTPLWIVYPYCYSGYLVSCALNNFTTHGENTSFTIPFLPFILCAIFISVFTMLMATHRFGKKEMQ